MIGNDIVDLQIARKESNWRRPNFLQKVFTPEEQFYITTAPDKDIALWLLWSRKESAYKIVARLKKCRFFAPKKLVNTGLTTTPPISSSPYSGRISFEEYTLSTTSVVAERYIHTVAHISANGPSMTSNCFYLASNEYAAQHRITRQNLIEDYAQRAQISAMDISIRKDAWATPHLYRKNEKQPAIISITHHGHYGGYALLLPPFQQHKIESDCE